MPDNWLEPTHVLMREVAYEQDYPNRGRDALPGVHAYYDILSEAGCEVDIWRTTYYHRMRSHQAIIDWVSATELTRLNITGITGVITKTQKDSDCHTEDAERCKGKFDTQHRIPRQQDDHDNRQQKIKQQAGRDFCQYRAVPDEYQA